MSLEPKQMAQSQSDDESLAARALRAAQIAKKPELYKVCEVCDSIVMRGSNTCPNCHGYRFDEDSSRIVSQALILGKRLPNSVPPSEML